MTWTLLFFKQKNDVYSKNKFLKTVSCSEEETLHWNTGVSSQY